MQESSDIRQRPSLLLAILAGILLIAAVAWFFDRSQGEAAASPVAIPDSSPARGKRALVDYGCAGCHVVPGVREAEGLVGPPLHYWSDRQYIAGRIQNTPENLISWIMNPQSIEPGSAMPNMGVTWGDARDIAAYLYTLRYER
jgi:mono/diheme cytochrome c family protein